LKRVLVTGSQGFIGYHLVDALARERPEATILGIGRSPENRTSFGHGITIGEHSLPAPITDQIVRSLRTANYTYCQCDIRDINAITQICDDFQPDIVFHLASRLRDSALRDLLDINIAGTQSFYLALHAARRSPAKLVLASSGSVYGHVIDADIPVGEGTTPRPLDPYSITKYAQENMALALGREFGIPTVVARIFNVVGPGQEERHLCGRLASQLVAIEVGLVPPTIEHGPLDNTRDFIDVRDVARGLSILAEQGENTSVYNLGTGVETRCQEIFDRLLAMTSRVSPIREKVLCGRGAFDMPRNVGSVSRISRLGYATTHILEASLHDVLHYYRTVAGRIHCAD
jgi:GDP-4-dehydro-6-deoxy-D-mannose reductase